jgi:hypothetical protein
MFGSVVVFYHATHLSRVTEFCQTKFLRHTLTKDTAQKRDRPILVSTKADNSLSCPVFRFKHSSFHSFIIIVVDFLIYI